MLVLLDVALDSECIFDLDDGIILFVCFCDAGGNDAHDDDEILSA